MRTSRIRRCLRDCARAVLSFLPLLLLSAASVPNVSADDFMTSPPRSIRTRVSGGGTVGHDADWALARRDFACAGTPVVLQIRYRVAEQTDGPDAWGGACSVTDLRALFQRGRRPDRPVYLLPLLLPEHERYPELSDRKHHLHPSSRNRAGCRRRHPPQSRDMVHAERDALFGPCDQLGAGDQDTSGTEGRRIVHAPGYHRRLLGRPGA